MKKKTVTKSKRKRKGGLRIGIKPAEVTTPRFMQVDDIKGIPTNPGVPKRSILS